MEDKGGEKSSIVIGLIENSGDHLQLLEYQPMILSTSIG
uniref:Uncharacterized protein n=1 Tax=Nelumbo nucifera TaxID=4432 RepID=A0A822XXZ9_NELNU|nr:TPA_asm: hypothetical protein HUJ06_023721 [Nelumbo nucifera]DAD22264.1 TPA_asm: hypothetical protein HUJ06_023727 [Nelumbo nucifera]